MLTLYYSRQGCHWLRLLQRLEEVRAEASGNPSAVHRSYVPLFRHIGSYRQVRNCPTVESLFEGLSHSPTTANSHGGDAL
jgi:hypothetical protein